MAIPFSPASLIKPTFNFLQIPELENSEMLKLGKLNSYCKKHWLNKLPEELSIYDINISTNNGAESYHSKLKSIVRTGHPRIWTFISILNDIIQDIDYDIGRLRMEREISRPRKKKDVKNSELRSIYKQRLSDGDYTPWQYLKAISHTIGNITCETSTLVSNDSEDSEEIIEPTPENSICVVCLAPRTTTWIFLPCRHANCCTECSKIIEDLEQPCPVCRTVIENRFQIYTS